MLGCHAVGEPRKVCVKENKRHPFSQELEQEINLIERKFYNGTDSVGRPAMSMEGGTIITYGAACPPPSDLPLKIYRETVKSAPTIGADFVVSNLTVSNVIKLVRKETHERDNGSQKGQKE